MITSAAATCDDENTRKHLVSSKGIKENVFLEANAGSGKTDILTQRIVAMIESGIHVENIAAITFTKKAANEFYNRLIELLRSRTDVNLWKASKTFPYSSLPLPTPESIGRDKDALQNIDSCFMGTIDSFCNSILMAHPVEAGIPASSHLAEDDELNVKYMEEYAKITNGEFGTDAQERLATVSMYYPHLKDDFPTLLGEMLDGRALPLHRFAPFPYTDAQREKIFSDYIVFLKEIHDLAKHAPLRNTKGARDQYSELERFLNLYEKIGDAAFNYNVYIPNGLAFDKNSDSEQFANANQLCPWATITCKQTLQIKKPEKPMPISAWVNQKYASLLDFFSLVIGPIAKDLKAQGVLSFYDNLLYVRNMLKKDIEENDGRLVRYIRRTYKYFLLDEFQDTDPLQAEIFFYLSSDHPKSKFSDCLPEPGALFMVGDPKQSIYAFRGADIASYLTVEDLFRHIGKVYCLANNYRSSCSLKRYFNQTFSSPDFFGSEINYPAIGNSADGAGDAKRKGGVYTYDGHSLAQVVKSLTNPIDGSEPYSLGEIMIITRSISKLNDVVKQLDEESIPYRLEGKFDLRKNKILTVAAAVLRECVDPQPFYLVNALEELGYTQRMLAHLRNDEKFDFYLPQTTDGFATLDAQTNEDLKKIVEISKLSYPSMLDEILRRFDLPDRFPSDNLEQFYFFNDLLRSKIDDGVLTTRQEIVRFIEGCFIPGGATNEPAIKPQRIAPLKKKEDKILVTNLHKVKGLEAKVVILAENGAARANAGKISKGGERYIFNTNPQNSRNPYCYKDDGSDSVAEESKLREVKEYKRLLYVAATRARNLLLIEGNKGGYWGPLFDQLGLDRFDALVGEESEKKEGVPSPSYSKGDAISDGIFRSSFQIKRPSGVSKAEKKDVSGGEKVIEESPEANPIDAEPLAEGWSRADSLMRGTIVHRLMEKLVLCLPSIPQNDEVVPAIMNEFGLVGTEKEKDFENILNVVYDEITQGGCQQEKDYAPQDILGTLKEADEIHCEIPFGYREGDSSIVSGYLDLLYHDASGWHIVDYKTNEQSTGLKEHYASQLQEYQDAFHAMVGKDIPVDARIYHIQMPKI